MESVAEDLCADFVAGLMVPLCARVESSPSSKRMTTNSYCNLEPVPFLEYADSSKSTGQVLGYVSTTLHNPLFL